MKIYTLFAGMALLLSGAAHAQSPPTPGLGCPSPLPAHTFCVTATGDSGAGSLRQAILDSDAGGGANTIDFDIPGSGPQTITVTGFPTINTSGTVTSLLIDGYSQPGSALNTNAPDQGGLNTKLMIELVGNYPGFSVEGFYYNCCGSPYITITLQGVAMHGFYDGINADGLVSGPKAQINVYGCFIGTKLDGTALPAYNSDAAVRINYDNGQIGGAQPWQRNLLSGMGGAVLGGGPNATIIVEGNLIGTDASGTLAIPNGASNNWPGLYLQGNFPGIRIGCTSAGANPTCGTAASRNVISGNHVYGIGIEDSAGQSIGGMQIKGNYIGTDWTGTKPLPNGDYPYGSGCPAYCGGIDISGSSSTATPATIIGGLNAGEGNLIAFNNGSGILVDHYSTNAIGGSFDSAGNAVHDNRAIVDIAILGVASGLEPLANDPGDADTGTNNKQNYPVIQSASVSGTSGNLILNVTYLVDSATVNSAYPLRVDFYVDVDEGSGEYLVSDSYPASSAQVARTVTLPLPANVQALAGIVATATTADHYTSEFSPEIVFDRIFEDGFEAR